MEAKNGAVVRKHLGYTPIPQRFAKKVNTFFTDFLNPHVNFHRSCFFPETVTDAKDQERKKYRYGHMMKPFEKLKSLPDAILYLKPGITLEQLDAAASRMSDNEAAAALNRARQALFQFIADAFKPSA